MSRMERVWTYMTQLFMITVFGILVMIVVVMVTLFLMIPLGLGWLVIEGGSRLGLIEGSAYNRHGGVNQIDLLLCGYGAYLILFLFATGAALFG